MPDARPSPTDHTQSWRRDMGAYRANCSCGWTSGVFFHEWRAVVAGEAHGKHAHRSGQREDEHPIHTAIDQASKGSL